MMRRILFLAIYMTSAFFAQAKIDVNSLISKLNNEKLTTTERLCLLDTITNQFVYADIEQARIYADKGLRLALAEKQMENAASFSHYFGMIYTMETDYDSAMIHYEKGLVYAANAQSLNSEGRINLSIGTLYWNQSKYEVALEYQMKALLIFEKTKDKERQLYTLANMGCTYRALYNLDRALFYLEQAKDIAEAENFTFAKIMPYYELAMIYTEKEESKKAFDYLSKALDISIEINNVPYKILCMQGLGTYFYKQQIDLDRAEKYALESLHLANEFGDPSLIHNAFNVLANIYRNQKRYKDCEEAAMKAWEIDSTNLQLSNNIAFNLVMSNIGMGNYEKAAMAFDKFAKTMRQYNDKSLHDALIEKEVKYETEKKEFRIASLEKEKKIYVGFGITGMILLLLAFGVLFYRHRLSIQKRKNAEQAKELAEKQTQLAEQRIKQLEQEKQLIATQAVLEGETTERARLARDLHDGLGCMLSVVKLNLKDMNRYSILEKIDVERFNRALGMLDQSISELRRVAHHIMPDSLMRFGLKVSLKDFCYAIPGTYFQYFGSEDRLDNRLEVTLYRCAYELVNNAIKHAQATTIHVQLIIDDGLVSLTVHDDGIGFDFQKVTSGSGLDNIRTRVSAYNGQITFHTSEGNGTEISIEIECGQRK